jgi:hypothetical protein
MTVDYLNPDGSLNLQALPAGLDLTELLAGIRDEGIRCSTPDPTKYHDPSTQVTEGGGVPLMHLMRPGRGGVRGVIIPRATMFGASQGWNPHNPPDKTVVIDPHLPAATVKLDLARVTPATASQAIRACNDALGGASDVEALRTKASAAFHVMAKLGETQVPIPRDERGHPLKGAALQHAIRANPQTASAAPPKAVAASEFAGLVSQVVPAAAPAAPPVAPQFAVPGPAAPAAVAVDVPPPAPHTFLRSFAPESPVAAAERLAGAVPRLDAPTEPSYRVIFDMPSGEMEAPFHHVVRQEGAKPGTGTLVLVYDNRFKGPKFFPKPTAEPFAVYVDGSPTVFLVESTGIQFVKGDETFCVLMIAKERPVNGPS